MDDLKSTNKVDTISEQVTTSVKTQEPKNFFD